MFAYALTAFFCAATPLFQLSQEQLDAYLARQQGTFEERLADVAHRSVGTPYAASPLGEGPGGEYDKDPLMDLTRVDCVTFCEQTIAMAASDSYKEASDLLQKIRYRGGKVDFETRNHFMIADWMANNTWCRDVSGDLGVETKALTRTISRRDFFDRVKAPKLGHSIPDQEMTIHYVPAAQASAAVSHLKTPALIIFIGKKPEWLFELHTGLYLPDAQGQGRLYHASSAAKKVVEVASLAEYVESQADRFLGFMAYRVGNPVAEKKQ